MPRYQIGNTQGIVKRSRPFYFLCYIHNTDIESLIYSIYEISVQATALFLYVCLINSKHKICTIFCRGLDLNCRPLVSEATALPTEPRPQPSMWNLSSSSFCSSSCLIYLQGGAKRRSNNTTHTWLGHCLWDFAADVLGREQNTFSVLIIFCEKYFSRYCVADRCNGRGSWFLNSKVSGSNPFGW